MASGNGHPIGNFQWETRPSSSDPLRQHRVKGIRPSTITVQESFDPPEPSSSSTSTANSRQMRSSVNCFRRLSGGVSFYSPDATYLQMESPEAPRPKARTSSLPVQQLQASRAFPGSQFPQQQRMEQPPDPDASDDNDEPHEVITLSDDDDLVVIEEGGLHRLFPNEPVLSETFTNYLQSLRTEDPQKYIGLFRDPPRRLHPMTLHSSCFVTVNDLRNVHDELKRISEKNPNPTIPKATGSSTYPGSSSSMTSIEQLSIHEYLISHILRAKEVCSLEYQKKKKSGSVYSLQELVMPRESEIATESVSWQTAIFNDLYKRTLMTPLMVEKRNGGCPPSGNGTRKRKRICTSKKTTPTCSGDVIEEFVHPTCY